MTIKGLTNTSASFPRIGKLRKGDVKSAKAPGRDLPYFRFDSSDQKAVNDFEAAYGEQPTKVNVLFPHPTVERNFQTAMEAYGAGGIERRCDRETIGGQRVDGRFSYCRAQCRYPQCECKEVGRLQIIIPELKRFAYVTAETHSINDIVNLTQQLQAIEMTFGRLNGVPLVLRRRPEQVSVPLKGGNRTRKEMWMLSVEVSPEWAGLQLEAQKVAALQQAKVYSLEPVGSSAQAALPSASEVIKSAELVDEFGGDRTPIDYLSTDLWINIQKAFKQADTSDRIETFRQAALAKIEEGALPAIARHGIESLAEQANQRLADLYRV